MKKVFIWIFLVMFVASLTFVSVGCKEEAASLEEAEEVTEEEAPAEEVAPAVEEEEEAEVVAEEKLQFAFVCAGPLTNIFIAEVIKGWDAACEPFGVESTEYLAEYDLAQTKNFFDSAIASNPDGIFLFQWYDPESFTPAIQGALDRGINIVTMTVRYPFTEKEVPYIGFDYKEQGYEVGIYIAKKLKEEGKITNVQIGVFHDLIASPLCIERAEGFYNALTDAGIDYEAFETETGEELSKATDVIRASIIAHPEWEVLYSTGDIPTMAAFKTLMDLGVEPGSVLCTGFNLEEEMIRGIRAGHGVVNSDEIFSYGFLPAVVLYMRIEYDAIVGDLPVNTVMIDQTNIDEYAD